jgi:Na+/proline symporter
LSIIDWIVLVAWLGGTIAYGLYRARGTKTVDQYLLAGKSMPWYAMGLSIMATQASAITFISTTGQAYVDGMRFVQFYFGLPIAMVLLSAFAVPIFHRAEVYTAYEYLEKRFDSRTRAVTSLLFLVSRGLGTGIALYAPAVVLSVIFGWSDRYTSLLMGVLVVFYTTLGGIKAVTWSDVQQMMVVLGSLIIALGLAIWMMPSEVSFVDALHIASAGGRLNPVTFNVDLNDRYNLFSGLFGGMFLALAYFGTDQSQVQRYLTGRSIGQSRLGLLLNAAAKVPMQFLILFVGVMVFVLFHFQKPPVMFEPAVYRQWENRAEFQQVKAKYDTAFETRRQAALAFAKGGSVEAYRAAHRDVEAVRKEAQTLTGKNDTNYIFLSYVTRYLPIGLVGLVMAGVFAAAMSSVSGEVNSLATVTVVDVYRKYIKKEASDSHYLWASRFATMFWGAYAVSFAAFAGGSFGALIEAVNKVGSLFYGGMLGVFILAFFFKSCTPSGAFWGVVVGEIAILAAARFTDIAFLWYNLIGPIVVVSVGMLVSYAQRGSQEAGPALGR